MWFLLFACAKKVSFDDPIPVDDWLPRTAPDAATLARYDDAAAWSEEHDGKALLVIVGDAIVYEHYAVDFSAETPHHLFSGTKTFACALAAAANADGLLLMDERASDTIPEWTDDRSTIEVQQLLHFTSGLHEPWWKMTWDGLKANPRVDDKYALALEQPVDTAPGTTFEYGSTHLMAFGALMGRKLDRDPQVWLAERVLDPIGLRFSGWIRDPAGNPAWPYGAYATANEWAKFGVLLRDDGDFLGARVLPAGALSACRVGSDANPAYGLGMWLNAEVGPDVDMSAFHTTEAAGPKIWNDGPADLFMAAGAQDQRLYVMPSLDTIVVRLGDGDRDFKDAEMLRRIVEVP